MRKMILYCICVVVIILITIFLLYWSDRDTRANVVFLEQYGWEVKDKEIEVEEVNIPKVFDAVYYNYNQLQKQAGLDLEPYKGKKAIRYTYVVLNYPKDPGEPVRANVICIGGKPVAGDIMTVSLRGFMHSLNYPADNSDVKTNG